MATRKYGNGRQIDEEQARVLMAEVFADAAPADEAAPRLPAKRERPKPLQLRDDSDFEATILIAAGAFAGYGTERGLPANTSMWQALKTALSPFGLRPMLALAANTNRPRSPMPAGEVLLITGARSTDELVARGWQVLTTAEFGNFAVVEREWDAISHYGTHGVQASVLFNWDAAVSAFGGLRLPVPALELGYNPIQEVTLARSAWPKQYNTFARRGANINAYAELSGERWALR